MNKKGVGLKPTIIGIIMIVMFSLFIFSFVQRTVNIMNPDSEIFDSKYKLNESMSKMDSIINNFTATSESMRIQLKEDKPTATDYVFLIFKGAFYIPFTLITFTFTGMSAIVDVLFPALTGTGAGNLLTIILDIIFATIIITVVLLIVKSIRSGESER